MLSTVGHYFDPWEAHVLRARLESEGIPATVAGDQHIIANWPLSVALGGAVLQVPSAYLGQAREIVADYYAGTLQADLVAAHPEAADACPACGEAQVVGTVPFGQRALAVATFLFATAPFPTRASRLRCQTCGHAWRYGG
ncbi:putative signal transducing protein [Arenimonas aestuarii]